MLPCPEKPALPPDREAEFDAYADGYDAGMDNPLKRLVGSSPADFLRVKARLLVADLRRRFPGGASLLDYGCGTGSFLRELAAAGFDGPATGCDVSDRMLAAARRGWPAGVAPEVYHAGPGEDAGRAGRFDAVVISAVLHHVEPADRPGLYRTLRSLLKPTGRLYVFEHNPWNPVTSWVVRHTRIDRNAVLVPAPELRAGLRAAGFGRLRTRYLMFVPPRLTPLQPLEACLRWLPLGGQYLVRAEPAG
jgi:2-polyprenyl-3-methyl-5-hydroxy-6-metoxy-1,4-benzoquinol methylase